MALFSDSDVVTAAALTQVDGEIEAVAAAESIILEGALGVIRQSWTEAKNEILKAQQLYNTWLGAGSLASGSAAVLGSAYSSSSIPRIKPSQIVVSSAYGFDATPLVTWMSYLALVNFYRAAANRKLKDRYDAKFTRYKGEAGRMWGILRSTGLPVLFRPMECPGAVHAVNAGQWGASNVTAVSGGSAAQAAYDVAITWVDQSQYVSPSVKGNAESGPSAVVTITVPATHVIQISILNLHPPAGVPDQVGVSEGQVVPLTATGWNVYAGGSGGILTLQNTSPIPVATTSYTLAGVPTSNGWALGPGQFADRSLFFQNIMSRA